MGKGPSKTVDSNCGEKEGKSEDPINRASNCAEVRVDASDAVPSQCIDVMFVCSEWGSSKGGLSTFNRELAVNLTKYSKGSIKVHCFVCQSTEEDRRDASRQGVNLIPAQRPPGSASDPLEWLKIPPPELPHPDIVVGHGRKFGSAAYFIRKVTNCKWIHFVHVYCEALGKYNLECSATADAIAENEEKNRRELELCEASDLVVAVGSLLQRKYKRRLPDIRVEVITPGIFEQYVNPAAIQAKKFESEEEFSIFVFGRGTFEDFTLKGYDIVGKAVASLGRKFELTFVGAPQDEQRKIEKRFLEGTNISRMQLTIRGFCSCEEIKQMFREADLIVMPSRTEGFGLVALEAISAGVPILVSSECGITKALQNVDGGMSVVVSSDLPEDWANRIRELSEQKPEKRHASAMQLREQYGKKYSWKKECEKFELMILELAREPQSVPRMELSTDTAPHHSDEMEQAKGNKKRVLTATDRAPYLSLERQETERNKQAESVPDPDTAPHNSDETEQGKINKEEVLIATDKATCSSLENEKTDRNKHVESRTGGSSVKENKKECNQFHFAARVSDVSKMEPTLPLGFSVDLRDATNRTPLMNAALHGKLEMVKALIEKGADPSLADNDGWNVLHRAAQSGIPRIIELILSHVTDIDSRTAEGFTPLMIAVINGNLRAAKCLMEKGADPSLKDNHGYSGWNVLHRASAGGDPHIIELILSRMTDIESRTAGGVTPLMVAAVHGKLQAVKYLLEKGADPSLEDKDGWNVLHRAAQSDNPRIIELILAHETNIESRSSYGSTPLIIAVKHGNLHGVKYLLERGADPSAEDNDGRSSLHRALSRDPDIMEALLSHVSKDPGTAPNNSEEAEKT